MVPLRNPRTLCGCQPVALMICCRVAPLGRVSRSMTLAVFLPVLLPSRTAPGCSSFFAVLAVFGALGVLGVFLPALAFFPVFTLAGATRGVCGAVWGFFSGFCSCLPAATASAGCA